MRPVTINPGNLRASLVEIERASHENDIVEIAQNFFFDNPEFADVFEILTDIQPDSATELLLHFENTGGLAWSSGAWTPDVRVNASNAGITYGFRVGNFVRIANLVYLRFSFSLTNKGASVGVVDIDGLPYTSFVTGAGSTNFYGAFAGLTSSIIVDIAAGTNQIKLWDADAAQTNQLDDTNLTNTSTFFGAIWYLTSAAPASAFIDSSKNNADILTNGAVVLSTAQFKFGTASALFDGSTGNLTVPDAAWNEFQGDFTVDCWVYPLVDAGAIFNKSDAGVQPALKVRANGDGTWRILASTTGAALDIFNIVTFGGLTLNTWQHLAVVRQGSNWYAFVNGVLGATTTSIAPYASTGALDIGAIFTLSQFFNGYIDEFRISSTARWTAAFTPPTIAYDEPTVVNVAEAFATFIRICQKGGLYRTT